ncbi:hypothetical protein FOA52_006856 [Chlamydomonas sp. UWO 241]|nr:hypothetical protein FOA52_006856 [Chlamydomonas sp. UWO 241]
MNHISRVCKDVAVTAAFYEAMGFVHVRRPSSLNASFAGAWLHSPHSSTSIHLIKGEPVPRPSTISPRADHVSFVCESLTEVENVLRRKGIDYIRQTVEEDGVLVTQLFFHDPENNMIEVCNCDDLPIIALSDASLECATCVSVLPAAAVQQQEQHEHDTSVLAHYGTLPRPSSDESCYDMGITAARADIPPPVAQQQQQFAQQQQQYAHDAKYGQRTGSDESCLSSSYDMDTMAAHVPSLLASAHLIPPAAFESTTSRMSCESTRDFAMWTRPPASPDLYMMCGQGSSGGVSAIASPDRTGGQSASIMWCEA